MWGNYMKILNYRLTEAYTFPQIIKALFEHKNVCIFDIETTGLNRNVDKVILIGYMYLENSKPIIKQIFAENYEEEKILLETFYEDLKKFNLLITYNGRNFDIPFLEARLNKHNLKPFIYQKDHIDIYQHIKTFKNHLNLSNYKLKSIESFLGIKRQDTISGKESVQLYETYRKSMEKTLLDKILLHNYEDIYHLGKVLSIYNHLPIDNREFTTVYLEKIYNQKIIKFKYNIIDIAIKEKQLYICGKTDTIIDHHIDEIHHHQTYKFEWAPKEGIFKLFYLIKKHKINDHKSFHAIDISNLEFITKSTDYYKNHLVHNNLILTLDSKINIDPVTQLIDDTIQYILS